MRPQEGSARYGTLLISLHWVMLLLIKTWHFMLGLVIFAVVWLRLLARFLGPVPAIVPRPPQWQMLVAHLTEFAIYVFMIAMPLLGWLILSGESQPVPFFGLHLPALIGENKALHAAAALAHHYFHRDNTLVRMLPSRLAKSKNS